MVANPDCMQDCAKKIVSDETGVGRCMGAIALIGCRRKQNTHDLHGWRSTQQSISAMALGSSKV